MFYGIDLGTTNSSVAYVELGQIKVVENRHDSQTTRSAVFFESRSEHYVGAAAVGSRELNPENYVECIKRKMTDDYSKIQSTLPYGFTPIEISAKILQHLVNEANEILQYDCKDVVITVPARFDSNARARTRQAAEIAELNVIDIVDEPTAAVAGYYEMLVQRNEIGQGEKNVLVFDLGGGTFDISICKISNAQTNKIKVLMTGGDEKLGGHDWDMLLAKHIIEDKLGGSFDDLDDRELMVALESAEEAKKQLTSTTLSPVRNLNIELASGQRITVSRSEFNEWTSPLCEKAMTKLNDVLRLSKERAGVGSMDIDQVLLVGGSTHMIQIQEALAGLFGRSKLKKYQPELIVAIGAVAYNRMKESEKGVDRGDPIIADIVGRTYGFEVRDRNDGHMFVQNLLFRDENRPVRRETIVGTSVDNQTAVEFEVWESDSLTDFVEKSEAKPVSEACSKLCLPNGLPKDTNIRVEFSLDKSSILHVTASLQKDSKYQMEFEVKMRGTMTKSEVATAKRNIGKDLS